MPELPEVEITRRFLERHLLDQTITDVRSNRPDEQGGVALLRRQTAQAFYRRGKTLWVKFSGEVGLLSHLGMTGKFLVQTPETPRPAHTHAVMRTKTQDVLFCDPRRFGAFWVGTWSDVIGRLPTLGPDPLLDGLSGEMLQKAFRGVRRPIKTALLDQQRLAGVGNIYASESLFRARIHPEVLTDALTIHQWRSLSDSILASITRALAVEGEGPMIYLQEPNSKNPFLVYGRPNTPCPVCKTLITRLVQAGRSTFFCSGCQQRSCEPLDN
jgi:formamidopyrimidine-DNA glycosylase